jgi:LacI family transcriptional regulator
MWSIAGYASGDLPSAGADLAAAADLAASHLASLGHRTVACISSPAAALPGHLLVAATRRAGLTVPGPMIVDTPVGSVEGGRRCCHCMLAEDGGAAVTAILTGSDILAAGCLAALAGASLPCPQAVSVAGAGDLPLAGSLATPLTTIRLHERAAGAAAAGLLLRRLDGGDGAAVQTIQFLPELVVRGSTAPQPACPARGSS